MLRRQILLTGVPFAVLSVGLLLGIDEETAKSLAPALVGLTMALAIFAINFSFVAFQLAPYRHLHQGPSKGHLVASVLLVALALVPLLGSFCGSASTGQLAAAVTPLVAYGAVILVALALREAEPERMLETRASEEALDRFAVRFEISVMQQIEELEQLDFEADLPRDERLPPPTHEIFHRVPPPPLRNDPIELCVRVAKAAIGHDDAAVFLPAVERLLVLVKRLRTFPYKTSPENGEWKIAGAAETHGTAALNRIVELLRTTSGHTSLADRFIELIARNVRQSAFEARATSDEMATLFMIGVAVAQDQVDESSGAGVIGLLLAARRVSDQTVRSLEQEQEPLAEHNLAIYASGVEAIGESAIDARNSDLLFRCLETLSWIGCSAVRFGGHETGRRAAAGLVQLGRMARHAGLECHWPRCTLTPSQHARERLVWMASWIPQAENPDRWLESLGTAFARLDGFKRELRLNRQAAKPTVELVTPEDAEPHTESFFSDGGTRTLNYSDESMLKYQVLH